MKVDQVILDKIKKHGYWRTVPGWSGIRVFDEFHSVVEQALPHSYFVEVGAWKGQTASLMASLIQIYGKKIYFDVVDTWEGSDEEIHLQDEDVKHGTLYESFLHYTKPFKHIIHPVKLTSLEASNNYNDSSIDFIFLDASHTTEDVLNDIEAWTPKLKEGGVLIGDDYDWQSVKEAVLNSSVKDSFVELINVTGSFWKYVRA